MLILHHAYAATELALRLSAALAAAGIAVGLDMDPGRDVLGLPAVTLDGDEDDADFDYAAVICRAVIDDPAKQVQR